MVSGWHLLDMASSRISKQTRLGKLTLPLLSLYRSFMRSSSSLVTETPARKSGTQWGSWWTGRNRCGPPPREIRNTCVETSWPFTTMPSSTWLSGQSTPLLCTCDSLVCSLPGPNNTVLEFGQLKTLLTLYNHLIIPVGMGAVRTPEKFAPSPTLSGLLLQVTLSNSPPRLVLDHVWSRVWFLEKGLSSRLVI